MRGIYAAVLAVKSGKRVTRVSLSDWLAFQARIRGSKDPRLLRDRPTDGAAVAMKTNEGVGRALCMVWGECFFEGERF